MLHLKTNQFKTGTNRIQFKIEKSRPINIDFITILRSRPSTVELDKEASVTQVADNNYQAEINFPQIGSWDLIAKVNTGGKEILFSNRISVHE